MKLKEAIAWCAGSVVTFGGAVAFLFMTFQTSADADKQYMTVNARQDRQATYLKENFQNLNDKMDKIGDKLDQVLLKHR